MTLTKKHLNANQIKLIAIIAMTIDHLTWAFFPGLQAVWYVYALHIIGRLTAPIMWYFIAEGCYYTRNIRKYAGRLFVFAIISHFAYNFAFGIPFLPFSTGSFFNQTGVMWSLAWAVVLIGIFLIGTGFVPGGVERQVCAGFCQAEVGDLGIPL